MSNWDFGRKYLLLPVTLFFIYCTIGQFIEMSIRKIDLLYVKGKIISIQNVVTSKISKPFYKHSVRELRIYVEGYQEYFRISDNFNYRDFIADLAIGDTVYIYHRNLLTTILGMGRQFDIYQLENKNRILFDLENRKQNASQLTLVSFMFSFFFGVFYLLSWLSDREVVDDEDQN
ncbi:MAG: hypothetical protein HZB59_06195 [Ignavibacteriales bacterium]|nr:hypothetical protein [Ignavibacteriales bacterium]